MQIASKSKLIESQTQIYDFLDKILQSSVLEQEIYLLAFQALQAWVLKSNDSLYTHHIVDILFWGTETTEDFFEVGIETFSEILDSSPNVRLFE